jgi:hypothetical protein
MTEVDVGIGKTTTVGDGGGVFDGIADNVAAINVGILLGSKVGIAVGVFLVQAINALSKNVTDIKALDLIIT